MPKRTELIPARSGSYGGLVSSIAKLLEQARRSAVRTVNGILRATYWEIGQRIVEFEQGGKARAAYGDELLKRLGVDLSARLGRGFSDRNLRQMRSFYQGWEIWQTPSAKFEARAICPVLTDDSTAQPTALNIWQTVSAKSRQAMLNAAFPLSCSHYVRLMSVEKPHARVFYESEAVRGGWSVRQLDRQILCTGKDDAVVEYAMGGISARVFASQYLTQLPNEETLRREIQATKRALTYRAAAKAKGK